MPQISFDYHKLDEGSSCFEEDIIGPTVEEQVDDGEESGEEFSDMENERLPRMQNPRDASCVPKADNHYNKSVSFSSHADFGGSPVCVCVWG